MTAPPPGAPKGKPRTDVLEAVAAATSAVAKDIKETVETTEIRRRRAAARRRWEPAVAVALVSVALLAWFAFPPKVDDADPRPPDRIAMDLKITVAAAAQQVEDYRTAKGALPASLAEAGVEAPNVKFSRVADGFHLSGTAGTLVVTYDSSQPLAEFARGLVAAGARP